MPFDPTYKFYFPQTETEIWGQWDGSVGTDTCLQPWLSEFCPQTHMVKGETQVPQVVSWSLYMCYGTCIHTITVAHTGIHHYGTYMYTSLWHMHVYITMTHACVNHYGTDMYACTMAVAHICIHYCGTCMYTSLWHMHVYTHYDTYKYTCTKTSEISRLLNE